MLRCPPTRIELKYEDGRNELQWARSRALRAAAMVPEGATRAATTATLTTTATNSTVAATTIASAAASARERLGLAASTR